MVHHAAALARQPSYFVDGALAHQAGAPVYQAGALGHQTYHLAGYGYLSSCWPVALRRALQHM